MTQTIRIGLTGPIGCGKSTVAGWLAERGLAVVDADAHAREVTAPGEPAHAEILARFGDPVRAVDGSVDRAALARLVFGSPEALRSLESIVHPLVRPRILAAIAAAETGGAPGIAIEAIKLVEGGLAELCDEVWLIACEPGTQRARLLGRGMSPDDAERRLRAQDGLAVRLRPEVDRIIETGGGLGQVRARVDEAWEAARLAAAS